MVRFRRHQRLSWRLRQIECLVDIEVWMPRLQNWVIGFSQCPLSIVLFQESIHNGRYKQNLWKNKWFNSIMKFMLACAVVSCHACIHDLQKNKYWSLATFSDPWKTNRSGECAKLCREKCEGLWDGCKHDGPESHLETNDIFSRQDGPESHLGTDECVADKDEAVDTMAQRAT